MTGRRAPSRSAPPVIPTKRLVAHVPCRPDGDRFEHYGPSDGEPVDLPAPCVRVRAGYWCACGASFIGTATWETTHLARVVPLGGSAPPQYVDDREYGYEAPVPHPTAGDRDALLRQIEALEIGTIVERHGVGIARRFGDPELLLDEDEVDAVPF